MPCAAQESRIPKIETFDIINLGIMGAGFNDGVIKFLDLVVMFHCLSILRKIRL